MDKQRMQHLKEEVAMTPHAISDILHEKSLFPHQLAEISKTEDDPPLRFNMMYWASEFIDYRLPDRKECGTVVCLAGLVCYLWADKDNEVTRSKRYPYDSDIMNTAAKLLDLTRDQAGKLFIPGCFSKGDLADITPDEAATAIQRMIDDPDIPEFDMWR